MCEGLLTSEIQKYQPFGVREASKPTQDMREWSLVSGEGGGGVFPGQKWRETDLGFSPASAEAGQRPRQKLRLGHVPVESPRGII